MAELLTELLSNPPLQPAELQPLGQLGPATVCSSSRLAGGRVALRGFSAVDDLREAALCLSAGSHPAVHVVGGFGDSKGGISLLFDVPSALLSFSRAAGAPAAVTSIAGLLKATVQILEFLVHCHNAGIAVLALSDSDMGLTESGQLSVLALRHAVAMPPTLGSDATDSAPPLSLSHVQRALRNVQPGSPQARQMAPETLTALQAANSRLQLLRGAGTAAALASPASVPVGLDVERQAAFATGTFLADLLGALTTAQLSSPAQAPSPTPDDAAGRSILLGLVGGLTRSSPEQRLLLKEALAALSSLASPALPSPVRLVVLTVQLPPQALPAGRPGDGSAEAAAAAAGPVVSRVVVPVSVGTTVGALASRALASAQGRHWTPALATVPRHASAPVGGDEDGAAHIVVQVEAPQPSPSSAGPSEQQGLLPPPPPRIAALLHPSATVAAVWGQVSSPDAELLPIVVVAAGAMVDRLRRLPVLGAPASALSSLQSSASSLSIGIGAAHLQGSLDGAKGPHPAGPSPALPGGEASHQHHHSHNASSAAGQHHSHQLVPSAGSPATVTSSVGEGGGGGGGGMSSPASASPPRELGGTPPGHSSSSGNTRTRAAAAAAPLETLPSVTAATQAITLSDADFPPVGSGALVTPTNQGVGGGSSSAAAGARGSGSGGGGGGEPGTAFAAVAARGSPTPGPAQSATPVPRPSAPPSASPVGTPLRPVPQPAAAATRGGLAAGGPGGVGAPASSSSGSASSSTAAGGAHAEPTASSSASASASAASGASAPPPAAPTVSIGSSKPAPPGAPVCGFQTVQVTAGGASSSSSSSSSSGSAAASSASAAEDASFVAEAIARIRPFGMKLAVAAGRVTAEIPRVPAAASCAGLVVSAAAKPSASSRDARVTGLRELMRDLQDRSHTRDDGRLGGFGGLGFIEVTLAALFSACFLGSKDEQAASYALQVAGNLAMNDGNRVRLAELSGIEMVTAAMGVHSSSPRVAKDAIVALRHLAYENDANKQRIVDCGAVAAVVKAMVACGDSVQVQRQACGALSIFAVHSALGDAAKRTIVAAGGLGAIHRAVGSHSGDTQLVTAGLKALGTLVGMPDARAAARDMGWVELLETLSGMAEHGGHRDFTDALRQTQRRLAGK